MLDWVENMLLAKGLKNWAHTCSQPTNYAEKILSRYKVQGPTGKVNRTSVYAEAAVRRVL